MAAATRLVPTILVFVILVQRYVPADLAHPLRPEAGMLRASEAPGANMDLDPAKIEREEELLR